MNPRYILYPVFAMVLLVAIVLLYMARVRLAAVRARRVRVDYYRAYQGDEPEELRVVARHFVNLFEMPVLFYLVVVLAYVTQHVDALMVVAAWAYVGLRYVHSWVHLGSNDVPTRFRLYFASAAVLLLMWTTLLVRIVQSA